MPKTKTKSFFKTNTSYTNEGGKFALKCDEILNPLYKQYSTMGRSTRELTQIFMSRVIKVTSNDSVDISNDVEISEEKPLAKSRKDGIIVKVDELLGHLYEKYLGMGYNKIGVTHILMSSIMLLDSKYSILISDEMNKEARLEQAKRDSLERQREKEKV